MMLRSCSWKVPANSEPIRLISVWRLWTIFFSMRYFTMNCLGIHWPCTTQPISLLVSSEILQNHPLFQQALKVLLWWLNSLAKFLFFFFFLGCTFSDFDYQNPKVLISSQSYILSLFLFLFKKYLTEKGQERVLSVSKEWMQLECIKSYVEEIYFNVQQG